MSLFCRIGLHRWTFRSQFLDESEDRAETEIVWARCRREGCVRYGAWSLVHREALARDANGDATARVA